ncbi:PREDICTED: uncharacterized protein LOC106742804 [Dinoponera quadriceps]|uniref:Uncharacterized protein LOC106742804 n=1 Tax=Dinoponera quadriceps TaxID=609295 RepID=A0A6P3WZS1_DINQU|nr:PREDICTED: uncharacterized protein LOC106742804 [Dinoponera quadriceps]
MDRNKPKERHNIRMLRGKKKGQFAKNKVVSARENNYVAIINRCREQAVRVNEVNKPPECFTEIESLGARRIVNLIVLGQQLWCRDYKIPLSINNILSEKRYGLASIFKVKCMQCEKEVFVSTDKRLSEKGGFIVNTKAALGMIDAGIGETHVNSLLTSMDVPSIGPKTIKIHERVVGKAIEEVAEGSCLKSIQLEKKLTVKVAKESVL